MSATEEVDEEHLELVEMRLDIDVDALRSYLVANSDFPDGPVEIRPVPGSWRSTAAA